MIDTLFLSACGPKGNCFIGVINALIDKKIIDLDKIKRYVCCSAGAIIGFSLCCGIDLEKYKLISNRLNYTELYDLEDLDNLFENQGLFSNKKIGQLVHAVIKYKYNKDDMTLKEFYDISKRHFICKTYNLSQKCNQYIGFSTHPDLSIITLIRMTTCIPIFFKPIVYNDEYYLDGGITGNMPFMDEYKDFIGIYICNKCDNKDINELSFIEYISKVVCCKDRDNNLDNKNIIKIECFNEQIGDFDITNERKEEFIKKSYNITIKYIDEHLSDKVKDIKKD